MEDFGTFFCKGSDGFNRKWRVYADVDPTTKQVDFIRLQYGEGTLPGKALRPSQCQQPCEHKALAHVRATIVGSEVIEGDFEVIDEEDY